MSDHQIQDIPQSPNHPILADGAPAPLALPSNTPGYLLSYMGSDGYALTLARPISISSIEESGRGKRLTLDVVDLTTSDILAIDVDAIDGLFPANAHSTFFIQNCKLQGIAPGTLHHAMVDYIQNTPNGAMKMPILQRDRIAELTQLTARMNWASTTPANAKLNDNERALLRKCVDTIFRARPPLPEDVTYATLSPFIRHLALDLLDIDPDVKSQWLDAETAGIQIRKLRQELQDARNHLMKLQQAQMNEPTSAPIYVASADGAIQK